ncbi:MAG: nucleotidyltransferase family protein [Thermoanaerobaculia bacterium]
MNTAATTSIIDPEAREFYVRALTRLDENKLPYLVGGAYAFARYTGIERHTKDFDIFIRRSDFDRAAEILGKAGYRTEMTFPHWIGKAWHNEDFIDLIFSAGNGVAEVDDLWFEHAVRERVLDLDVLLIPPEEMIWSKGLIMERERFDGADVAHVIQAMGPKLDWRRLIDRYGQYWRGLLAHVVLFGLIYPSDRSKIPQWVVEELTKRLLEETKQGDAKEKICYGTILSRQQYLFDITKRGYKDARLQPIGKLSREEIEEWTAGIEVDGAK